MSSPVVVQGTNVEAPFGSSPQPVTTEQTNDNNDAAKTGCKDPIFALLFYVDLIAIIAVAVTYGSDALENTEVNTYEGYLYAVLVTGKPWCDCYFLPPMFR